MTKRPLRQAIWVLTALIASLSSGQSERGASPLKVLITSVTPIAPQGTQIIIIRGHGFGTHSAYIDQDMPYLSIRDKTSGWAGGHAVKGEVDPVKLSVARWTDEEIVVTGFDGAYGRGNWRLRDGDRIEVTVWSPQTGAGPAMYDLTVGLGQGTATGTGAQSHANRPDNRKEQTPQSGEYVPDDVIVQNINDSLLTNSALKSQEILVTAQQGTVTLDGTVAGQMEKEAAERLVVQQPGVKTVVNNLVLATSSQKAAGAMIVRAIIQEQATSLELPPGQMYLYGMTTGGALPSSVFAEGQYGQVTNAAGQLSAALAYGTNSRNSYGTQTAYHEIGGVSVAGSWKRFAAYYGSNANSGAHDASISFQANEDSLVVVLGLASSQQSVSVEGVPGLEIDASRATEVIAHAYVKPGPYTVIEHSKVLAAGQDPEHMADLVGVFVFGGTQVNNQPVRVSEQRQAVSRGIDFLNFDYPSNCSKEMSPDFDPVIHVTNGNWTKNVQGDQLYFKVAKVVYGDVTGEGTRQAVVQTNCDGTTNFQYGEVYIFTTGAEGPKLLAKLVPDDWGREEEGNGSDYAISNVQVGSGVLAISFYAGGSHALPAWIDTATFQWIGNGLVRTRVDRRPFKPENPE